MDELRIQIWSVCQDLRIGEISEEEATDQLLNLFKEEVSAKVKEAERQEIAKIRAVYKQAGDLRELECQVKEYLDSKYEKAKGGE